MRQIWMDSQTDVNRTLALYIYTHLGVSNFIGKKLSAQAAMYIFECTFNMESVHQTVTHNFEFVGSQF